MKSSWIVLAACFAAFIYMLFGFVNHGAESGIYDWLIALAGTAVILIMTWVTVKNLLLSTSENMNNTDL